MLKEAPCGDWKKLPQDFASPLEWRALVLQCITFPSLRVDRQPHDPHVYRLSTQLRFGPAKPS